MALKPARLLLLLMAAAVLSGWSSCGGQSSQPEPPGPQPPTIPTFSAQRAWADLERQCAFGPRVPGSEAHAQCLAYLQTELGKYADEVVAQQFTASTAFGGPYASTNVIGHFGAQQAGERLLLCAHWDSRPRCDEDPLAANRSKPCPGANDGASGVAVLLEVARALEQQPPPSPVIIAFWDAEDAGDSRKLPAPCYGFCLGSQYYAEKMEGATRPDKVILLDMVGGDNRPNQRLAAREQQGNPGFDLPLERRSLEQAPQWVDEVYSTAERLGKTAFVRQPGYDVVDDHVPFLARGIPAVDLIDFDYPEWHTLDDTPEHCDSASLQQVGEVLVALVYAQ